MTTYTHIHDVGKMNNEETINYLMDHYTNIVLAQMRLASLLFLRVEWKSYVINSMYKHQKWNVYVFNMRGN